MSKQVQKKTGKKKIDTEIVVALIGLAGVALTAILGSPFIVAVIQRTPAPLVTSTVIVSGSSTPSTQDTVEVMFELPPASEPATLRIETKGKTVISIHLTAGTRQTVRLPPGDYTYTIESDYLHTAMPCTHVLQFETRSFSAKEKNLVLLPKMGYYPIPNCTPTPFR